MANRTDYPHVGEVVGYADTSKYQGVVCGPRPDTLVIGDSITYRNWANVGENYGLLKEQKPDWEVSAVPGRNIENAIYYATERVRNTKYPVRNLVLALGTNGSEGYDYADLRAVTNAVPASVNITFVTPYLQPAFTDEDYPVRSRYSTAAKYAGWERHIDTLRPNTIVADWALHASKYPSVLMGPLDPHPSSAGRFNWVKIVVGAHDLLESQ